MKNPEEEKIEAIIKTRQEAHSWFMKNSNVYRAFVDMEQKTYTNGKLEKKQKELIATGISVVINCESCMEWHIRQAIADGSTKEEIIEAIEVAVEMSGGPGTASARFAMNVLNYHLDQQKVNEESST